MARKVSVKIKRRAAKKSTTSKKGSASPGPGAAKAGSKQDAVLALLRRKSGASIDDMMQATGWQAHSVRGFLSGAVKKKLNLMLSSEKPENGERRYFVRGRS